MTPKEQERADRLYGDSPLASSEAKWVLVRAVVRLERLLARLAVEEGPVGKDTARAASSCERAIARNLEMLALSTPPPPANPFDDPDDDAPPAKPVETSPRAAPPGVEDPYAVDPKELEEDLTS